MSQHRPRTKDLHKQMASAIKNEDVDLIKKLLREGERTGIDSRDLDIAKGVLKKLQEKSRSKHSKSSRTPQQSRKPTPSSSGRPMSPGGSRPSSSGRGPPKRRGRGDISYVESRSDQVWADFLSRLEQNGQDPYKMQNMPLEELDSFLRKMGYGVFDRPVIKTRFMSVQEGLPPPRRGKIKKEKSSQNTDDNTGATDTLWNDFLSKLKEKNLEPQTFAAQFTEDDLDGFLRNSGFDVFERPAIKTRLFTVVEKYARGTSFSSNISDESKDDEDKKKEKNEDRKKNILEEICSSESKYLHHLELMNRCFGIPLKEKQKDFSTISDKLKPLFDVFNCLEDLRNFHTAFLYNLHVNVTDTFLRWTVMMTNLYVEFAKSYPVSLEILDELLNNTKFRKFLNQCNSEKELEGLMFLDLLVTPIQRVPRYQLLLQELQKYTNETENRSEYIDICASLELVKKVCTDINQVQFAEKEDVTPNEVPIPKPTTPPSQSHPVSSPTSAPKLPPLPPTKNRGMLDQFLSQRDIEKMRERDEQRLSPSKLKATHQFQDELSRRIKQISSDGKPLKGQKQPQGRPKASSRLKKEPNKKKDLPPLPPIGQIRTVSRDNSLKLLGHGNVNYGGGGSAE